MLKLAVTGIDGQVVRCLVERAAAASAVVIPLGRPELDLARPETIAPALIATGADVIVNAAAYTAVDQAEGDEAQAMAINGVAAGVVAETAQRMGIPVLHLSTDYVFDGTLARPYREDDPVTPIGAYGRTKLAGERAVAAAGGNHAILRTAWVFSPYGKNFIKTMLRLGETMESVRVVADQIGNPTSALDIANAVIGIARRLAASDDAGLRGIFHMTGQGDACWADVAEAIFVTGQQLGRRPVRVQRIATADYPTPARRPANSRLDCTKLQQVHGITLPHWRGAVSACVERLIADSERETGR